MDRRAFIGTLVVLPRQVAEALAARAIREEKNIGSMVTEAAARKTHR